MNKEKIIGPFIALIAIIAVLLIVSLKKSYPTLKEAVRATSRGGEIGDKIDCNQGEYVFIKNSNVMTSGYFYQENSKWYYESGTTKKDFQVEENILVSVYYLKGQDVSVLEIIADSELDIKDSEKTDFIKKKKEENHYMAFINKKIDSNYTITINEKDYNL